MSPNCTGQLLGRKTTTNKPGFKQFDHHAHSIDVGDFPYSPRNKCHRPKDGLIDTEALVSDNTTWLKDRRGLWPSYACCALRYQSQLHEKSSHKQETQSSGYL